MLFAAAVCAEISARAMRTIRVLLVDDHRIMREGIASLLEDEPDIEVVAEAANGQEALELVRKHEPEVVIMDVTMPVMNGVEATKRISREHPGVRVIGLSVHQRADMAMDMTRAGAHAYLTKDGPAEHLIAAIRGEPPAAAEF